MFVCTYNEEKRDRLVEEGFKMLFKQNQGDKCLYVFEPKPTLYASFSEEDKKEIFISNKMYMA